MMNFTNNSCCQVSFIKSKESSNYEGINIMKTYEWLMAAFLKVCWLSIWMIWWQILFLQDIMPLGKGSVLWL